MTPRKNRINENSPGAFSWPVRNFARRALGVGTQPTSLEYFMTPRKDRINENSHGASPWPVRNFARRALGVGTQPARKLSMGLFTESDHNFGPGDFP
ncbi:hypothetical protein QVD17_14483 [Tagetes erecta]|uniref:Uncharacterized protein n=1 Tax=Tagetes erecta TaxID=13708 RepID=A0AAD8P407_TARER|nr:hypothetical protein QVD17_14483 [Tagetes erecta]